MKNVPNLQTYGSWSEQPWSCQPRLEVGNPMSLTSTQSSELPFEPVFGWPLAQETYDTLLLSLQRSTPYE